MPRVPDKRASRRVLFHTPRSPTHPAFSPRLLNLTGAPPLAPEEMENSPPKKRSRNREKKKQTGDQVAAPAG